MKKYLLIIVSLCSILSISAFDIIVMSKGQDPVIVDSDDVKSIRFDEAETQLMIKTADEVKTMGLDELDSIKTSQYNLAKFNKFCSRYDNFVIETRPSVDDFIAYVADDPAIESWQVDEGIVTIQNSDGFEYIYDTTGAAIMPVDDDISDEPLYYVDMLLDTPDRYDPRKLNVALPRMSQQKDNVLHLSRRNVLFWSPWDEFSSIVDKEIELMQNYFQRKKIKVTFNSIKRKDAQSLASLSKWSEYDLVVVCCHGIKGRLTLPRIPYVLEQWQQNNEIKSAGISLLEHDYKTYYTLKPDAMNKKLGDKEDALSHTMVWGNCCQSLISPTGTWLTNLRLLGCPAIFGPDNTATTALNRILKTFIGAFMSGMSARNAFEMHSKIYANPRWHELGWYEGEDTSPITGRVLRYNFMATCDNVYGPVHETFIDKGLSAAASIFKGAGEILGLRQTPKSSRYATAGSAGDSFGVELWPEGHENQSVSIEYSPDVISKYDVKTYCNGALAEVRIELANDNLKPSTNYRYRTWEKYGDVVHRSAETGSFRTPGDTIYIHNAEELYGLRNHEAASGLTNFMGYTIVLLDDIEMAAPYVRTIIHTLQGTFDGNHHTVTIDVPSDIGSFDNRFVSTNYGTIKNLNLKINTSKGYTMVYDNSGTVSGIRLETSSKDVTGMYRNYQDAVISDWYVDGAKLCETNEGYVSDCVIYEGADNVADGSAIRCNTSTGVIRNCEIHGSATPFESNHGVITECRNYATSHLIGSNFGLIYESEQHGDVNALLKCTEAWHYAPSGLCYANYQGGELVNCRNYGTVTGITVAGICNQNQGLIDGCENYGEIIYDDSAEYKRHERYPRTSDHLWTYSEDTGSYTFYDFAAGIALNGSIVFDDVREPIGTCTNCVNHGTISVRNCTESGTHEYPTSTMRYDKRLITGDVINPGKYYTPHY